MRPSTAARGGRAAQPHRGAHPHRLRLAQQAGHPEGPRRAAGSRRGAPDQGGLRLGSRHDVPHPATPRSRHFREAVPEGERAGRRLGRAARRPTPAHSPSVPRELRRRIAGELPPSWDADLPVYAEARRAGDPQRLAERAPGAQGARCRSCSAAPRTCRRATSPTSRASGDLSGERAGRNIRFGVREHAMGGIANGIAYHGGLLPYVGDVPELQRLHARLRAPRGALGAPRRVRLDARLGRPRRGRTDAPAGRALRGAARHAQPDVRAARRPQRGGRRVARSRSSSGTARWRSH